MKNMEGYIFPDHTRRLTEIPLVIQDEQATPLIVDNKPEAIPWYLKLWLSISEWEGWSDIILAALIILEGALIGFLLYWFKYM